MLMMAGIDGFTVVDGITVSLFPLIAFSYWNARLVCWGAVFLIFLLMEDKLSLKRAAATRRRNGGGRMVSIILYAAAGVRTCDLPQDGFLQAMSNLLEHMVLVASLESADCK